MSGETTSNNTLLQRTEWLSDTIKETLEEELMVQTWLNWAPLNDGSATYTVPSIGDAIVDDYTEEDAIKFRPLDKGQFTLNIDEHISSGHYITDTAMEDTHYAEQLVSAIPNKEIRAVMKRIETDILKLQGNQTAANTNLINGQKHRFVGTGSSNTIGVEDFARASLAFDTANVSPQNRIAILHPSAAFSLNTLTNLTNVSNNPMFEGVVADSMFSGMKFTKNVYGFDVYVSNYVDTITAETLETVDCAGFAANVFMSANGDERPWMGAWARMPRFKSWPDEDHERTKYVTTGRYGLGVYRPESVVVVPTSTSV